MERGRAREWTIRLEQNKASIDHARTSDADLATLGGTVRALVSNHGWIAKLEKRVADLSDQVGRWANALQAEHTEAQACETELLQRIETLQSEIEALDDTLGVAHRAIEALEQPPLGCDTCGGDGQIGCPACRGSGEAPRAD